MEPLPPWWRLLRALLLSVYQINLSTFGVAVADCRCSWTIQLAKMWFGLIPNMNHSTQITTMHQPFRFTGLIVLLGCCSLFFSFFWFFIFFRTLSEKILNINDRIWAIFIHLQLIFRSNQTFYLCYESTWMLLMSVLTLFMTISQWGLNMKRVRAIWEVFSTCGCMSPLWICAKDHKNTEKKRDTKLCPNPVLISLQHVSIKGDKQPNAIFFQTACHTLWIVLTFIWPQS